MAQRERIDVITLTRSSYKQMKQVHDEILDAAYAAAVEDTPTYPYESEAERAAARRRRNERQRAVAE